MTTIVLEYPLQHGESPITELNIRRPLYRDVKGKKATDLADYSYTIDLLSKLTQLPVSVFDNLDYGDMFKCIKVLNDFLPNSQKEIQPEQ
ncbi:MAG: phage tail assembly protein [Silvanigrellaceae bacterium]|nr:phage tail assembly protein [Silvanigrellaceae bacterium]